MVRAIPILLLVRELGIGGCERDLTKIARLIDRSRFEPHVGTLYPDGIRAPEIKAAGVPVFHFPVRSLISSSLPSNARLLGKYLKDHHIQLIHCFDMPTEILAVPIARFYRVPVVVKSSLWHRDLVASRYMPLVRITDKLVDGIVVNSAAIGKELIEKYGIPERRIHLCYNGIERESFHPDARIPTGAVDGRAIVIGAACALRAEKRLDWLMEAFARVRAARPGVRLLIVGSGPVREQLEALRVRLGIVDESHFEPIVSDVAVWMRRIDIFVLSSESESFPNALLEAMACGCCVVGSKVGGVPELISDGQDGLLFCPGNVEDLAAKLTLLVDRPDLRSKYATAAVRTAHERFPMQRTVARIEEIYDSLLARKSADLRRAGFAE